MDWGSHYVIRTLITRQDDVDEQSGSLQMFKKYVCNHPVVMAGDIS